MSLRAITHTVIGIRTDRDSLAVNPFKSHIKSAALRQWELAAFFINLPDHNLKC